MIGYIGAFLLSVCAFPQMIMSINAGHSKGLSHGFLLSWYVGELCMLYFCVDTIGMSGPLFWNYTINTIMLTVIVRYKYWERRVG
jgi:uncharacterized protein with PQ loop repeat